MSEAAWSLHDLIAVLTILTVLGGSCLSGWIYFIQGKIKKIDDFSEDVRDLKTAAAAMKGKATSIAAMWLKFDSHVEKYAEDRLADAKEFATQAQMNSAVERIEKKIDDSEGRLEERIATLDHKLDRLLRLRGIGDGPA